MFKTTTDFLRTARLSLAAATLALCGLTACSSDDSDITDEQPDIEQTAEVRTYTVSIPASFEGDAQSRAVSFDADGSTSTTTFQTTDKIYAYNETKTAWSREYSDWGTLTPSANAKQTELNGTLAFARWNGSTSDAVTPEVGDVIHLFYNMSSPDFSSVTSSLFSSPPGPALSETGNNIFHPSATDSPENSYLCIGK